MRWRFRPFALAGAVMALLALPAGLVRLPGIAPAARAARGGNLYRVNPDRVTLAMPSPPPGVTEASITITRGKASPSELVTYSVYGDFYALDGRMLPRHLIRIRNEYGDPPATENVVVLASQDSKATFWVQVLPEAWFDDGRPELWRYSGQFSGTLVSNVCGITPYSGCGAVPIAVMVDIQPYTTFQASPQHFTVKADSGPGWYESQENVSVTVRANHRGWGLWWAFQAPVLQASGRPRTIPLSQLAISEDGSPYRPVPTSQELWLSGASTAEPRLVLKTLRMQVGVTWNERAGTYQGAVDLTLEAFP